MKSQDLPLACLTHHRHIFLSGSNRCPNILGNYALTLIYYFYLSFSSGQLRIPSHISILHVEQEVVGDETPALQSVLECDFVREGLLKREREISAAINNG